MIRKHAFSIQIIIVCVTSLMTGCASLAPSYLASTNAELHLGSDANNSKASFDIKQNRGKDPRTLLVLALSGGGSRAAYWSASVMLKMQTLFADEGVDLLSEVDAISSVSGGSLPAAYYAVSYNPAEADLVKQRRIWDEATVKELMTRKYLFRWYGNWFWPTNMAKFWATSFDRSDIMAQTFADNLYDAPITGTDYTFEDINPERPYLILNSTNGTQGQFAKNFTFTHEDFSELIDSDISQYKISRAVMATAAFPAVFNYMTLRNHKEKDKRQFVHVFDGGSHDNLGLSSVERLIEQNKHKFDRIGVILLDAYTNTAGTSVNKANPRSTFDYLLDSNFIDSFDALLARSRDTQVKNFFAQLGELAEEEGKEHIFYHVTFESLEEQSSLRERVNDISTNFVISNDQIATIDEVVDTLFTPDNQCMQKVKDLVTKEEIVDAWPYSSYICRWPHIAPVSGEIVQNSVSQ